MVLTPVKYLKGPARFDSRLILLPTWIEDGVLTVQVR